MTYKRIPGATPDLFTRHYWTPADRGYLAESQHFLGVAASTAPATAGRLEFVRIKLPTAASITNLLMFAAGAGATLTAGQCFAALYTSAGALLGQTADQAAAWVSVGLKTMALVGGAQALPAGDYNIGFWYNGTTSPTWARGAFGQSAFINQGRAAPNLLFGNTNDTGLTTTAPATMGTESGGVSAWWAALS